MNCCRFFRRSNTVTPASKEEKLLESAGGCEHSMGTDQTQHKSDNDNPQQLPYTTVELKVALNCEGCKRKVVKALCTLQGVKKIDISTKLQKVAVSGYVDPWKVLKTIKGTGKKVEFCSAQEEHKAESEAEREQAENSFQMLDCPVEPLAAIQEQQNPPVKMSPFLKKLKFKSYVALDAEYQDPNYEPLNRYYPSRISSLYDLPPSGSKADRNTLIKLGENYSEADKFPHTSRFQRSTRRRSSNTLPGLPVNHSHLDLHHSRRVGYETHLSPAAVRSDKARNSESYGCDYNDNGPGKVSLFVPETKNVLNTVTEESYPYSDDESEEVFALVKTKSGLRLVPVIDFSAKSRKSRVDHRDYPTIGMRKQGREMKQRPLSTKGRSTA